MTISAIPHRHSVGVNRRELLQVGFSGLLGLSALSAVARGGQGSAAPVRSPKSVIIVFLTGAPSHIDTFDVKPDAPAEIRGEFKPIATSVAGLQISELLPRMAARAHKYALVRSF